MSDDNHLPGCETLTLAQVAALPAADTLILTVNNRLARRLVQELATHLRRERQVSELPRVLPLSAWLGAAADELAFASGVEASGSDQADVMPAYRLDAFAAQLLWTRVISEEESGSALLDVAQAARLAADADTLMAEWRIEIPSGADTEEYRSFAHWRARYRDALRRIDAEDVNRLYERVLDAARADRLAVPGHIVLAGFSDESPRFALLLRALRERGAMLMPLAGEQRGAAVPGRHEAHDRADEWRAAAAWAAQRLTENPAGRYAIVSAQLEDEAPHARRVLGRALAAGGHAYNVAVGRPLSEWPAARAALAWLDALARMARDGHVEVAVLGAALLSGHCAGDERDAARHAVLDARWRRNGALRRTSQQWLRDLQDNALSQAWTQAMQVWQEVDAKGPQPADAWVPAMRGALGALGFPGEGVLDSVAYQVVSAWGELFGRFGALAPVAGLLDGPAAVHLLARIARATAFQPQRDPSARLDVLGLLEAEGGAWDGMWMLGLTDDVLPASPKPNPLLPLMVLRATGAPRATPERERQWAEAMFAALCTCAREIVASHARHEGESELRPSPLIAALPCTAWQRPAAACASAWPQQRIDDDRGPPLPPFDPMADEAASGSTGGLDVLDTQARNPLWAFARHRLGARLLEDYALSASASQRGQFLHGALEQVWRMLPDQEQLHEAVAQGRLGDLLDAAIAQAAEAHLAGYDATLRELECERACKVLEGWFDLEAQRTPFVVDQVERKHPWTRGALRLHVRLDRMDRLLADNRAVIVDYKTGMSPGRPESDWSRARPINLQLPFYAAVLAGEDPGLDVAALMLAQIHARQVGVQGLADDDAELGLKGVKGIADSKEFAGRAWRDALAGWRSAIEGLADEYAAGFAANIVASPKDLEYCDAMPFLRWNLEGAQWDDGDEEGDDA
ncbi:MAG TPA: PD-(D/E)XK nuclease family protein [Bordetella sp.]|uniref:PD-(D/E)XK nuclease family protein n=1 Tax=Bordetella sp. TaxID=28081 RepID=UPI002ED32B2B